MPDSQRLEEEMVERGCLVPVINASVLLAFIEFTHPILNVRITLTLGGEKVTICQ